MRITDEMKAAKNKFMVELWDLIKEYDTVEESETYWDKMIREIDALAVRHIPSCGEPFCRQMCVAYLASKEQEYKMSGFKEREHGAVKHGGGHEEIDV